MATPRRTSRLGTRSTRSGLADRAKKNADDPQVATDRGTDALLAKAREAGGEEAGPDESTLSTIQSLLRDV